MLFLVTDVVSLGLDDGGSAAMTKGPGTESGRNGNPEFGTSSPY